MEKITKEIEDFKITPIKKNMVFYIARDNREFKTEYECRKYEEILDYNDKFNKIKKIEFSGDSLFANLWYYAENEEELEMIKNKFNYNDNYNNVRVNGVLKRKGDLKVGDWIAMEYDDGGDCRGDRYFYTLSYIMEAVSSFQNSFINI
jgi:hypothetical protein